MKVSGYPIWLLIFLFLAGCSSEPKKPAEESAKPAVATPAKPTSYTGREAITKLYIAARLWAADAKPYKLESSPTMESNGQDGKSQLWRVSFASAMRKSVKSFTWAGVKTEDVTELGISSNPEDFTFSPTSSSTQVFDIAYLKTDTDNAVEQANKNGGAKILKADPSTPVNYLLNWDARKNEVIWHVLYGPSRTEPKLGIAVDATSGVFQRVER